MRNEQAPMFAITVVVLTVLIGLIVWARRDRYTLKVPDGLAFSEFKGYDTSRSVKRKAASRDFGKPNDD